MPLDADDIAWWESLIIEKSMLVVPTKKLKVVSDPDDDKFVEAAVEGKANVIISQDKHLLSLKNYKDIKIITPETFLEHIQ